MDKWTSEYNSIELRDLVSYLQKKSLAFGALDRSGERPCIQGEEIAQGVEARLRVDVENRPGSEP